MIKEIEKRIDEFTKFRDTVCTDIENKLTKLENKIKSDETLARLCNQICEERKFIELSFDSISKDATRSDYYIVGFFISLTKDCKIVICETPLADGDLEKSSLEEAISHATLENLKETLNIIDEINYSIYDIIMEAHGNICY